MYVYYILLSLKHSLIFDTMSGKKVKLERNILQENISKNGWYYIWFQEKNISTIKKKTMA